MSSRDFNLYHANCLEAMTIIPDQSVQLVLTDLPYGTTAAPWDSVIPMDKLWKQWRRILKPGGSVVLTCTQPFTTTVTSSNLPELQAMWYWLKDGVTGFTNVDTQPLRCIEDVVVFQPKSGVKPVYNAQGLARLGFEGEGVKKRNGKSVGGVTLRGDIEKTAGKGKLSTAGSVYEQTHGNWPKQLIYFARDKEKAHPTAKPVALMSYLIKTYSNPGDMVLDCCMGGGSTGMAAVHTDRAFTGIEMNAQYFALAHKRIEGAVSPFDKVKPKFVIFTNFSIKELKKPGGRAKVGK